MLPYRVVAHSYRIDVIHRGRACRIEEDGMRVLRGTVRRWRCRCHGRISGRGWRYVRVSVHWWSHRSSIGIDFKSMPGMMAEASCPHQCHGDLTWLRGSGRWNNPRKSRAPATSNHGPWGVQQILQACWIQKTSLVEFLVQSTGLGSIQIMCQ